MIALVGAFIAVAIIFHIFVFHKYNYPWTIKLINKIPGPDGIFYFGSALQFWNRKNEDRIGDICRLFEEHGPTYRLWFSGVPMIFISQLEDFQTVLSSRSNSRKGIIYRNVLPWLGRGLLTSSGQKWHTHRKIITPTFHFSILQGFVDTFNKNTQKLIRRLSGIAGDTQVDLAMYITQCTLDNICETAMGTEVNALSDDPNNYVSAVFRMGAIITQRLFSPLLFPNVNFALSKVGQEHKTLLKQLHNFTEKVIGECRSMRNENRTPAGPDDGAGHLTGIYSKKFTFLQLLLAKQSEYGLSDKDIREEVDTFMFEGHDTTSMGITWTLFELGCHQNVQQKCYEEQASIFHASNRAPTYQDIMKMTYLKQVIQESLRLHPSVPIISRKFPVDMQLKDFLVPANTEIVMCIYHLHRNPQVYPNPKEFNPDRFTPQAVENRNRFAYLPFSAGLRNCVGQRFAMLELMIVISSIIRRFDIKTINNRSDMKAVPDMTLRPATPILWHLSARDVRSTD